MVMPLDSVPSGTVGLTTPARPVFSGAGSVSPVRPEARRAYGDELGMTSDGATKGAKAGGGYQEEKRDNTVLLQQAANYASLAPSAPPKADSSSGTHSSGAEVVGYTALWPKRRLTRSGRMGRARDGARSPVRVATNEADDVETYDAPRLSISSAESSGGSEVKTPESVNPPPPWVPEQSSEKEEQSGRPLLGKQKGEESIVPVPHHAFLSTSNASSSPIVDITDGLADAGLERADYSIDRRRSSRLMDAAAAALEVGQQTGAAGEADGDRKPSSQFRASSGLPTHSRASTIRARRPNTLLRLPSARTDETARPSPPSSSSLPSTAGPTPAATADNSFGKARDPMDGAEVTSSGHGRLSSSFRSRSEEGVEAAESLEAIAFSQPAASLGSPLEEECRGRGMVASPDSWRSLLPEHDPFFISPQTLSSGNSSRAASLVGAASLSQRMSYQSQTSSSAGGHAQESSGSQNGGRAQTGDLGEDSKRRMSNESMQSSFSLPGPTAASMYASSNASGSLYDLDGTYNSGGSRAAFAPLQYHYNHSSKSLASPLLQSCLFDGESARFNTTDERQDMRLNGQVSSSAMQAASRRHASFSAFDTVPTSHASLSQSANDQSQHAMSLADQHERARPFGNRFQSPLKTSVLTSSPERQNVVKAAKPFPPSGMSPSSPASSCAMGNEGSRESWPSSRNSLQGWQAGVSNATQNPIQAFDLSSVDQRLADGMEQSSLRGEVVAVVTSPPALLSTSTCTTNRVADDEGGLAQDHRMLTTTTTTMLTTTTTTLLPSLSNAATPLASSPAVQPSGVSDFQTKADPVQRTQSVMAPPKATSKKGEPLPSSYDVSPLSPPSLPFLDSRPAPSSTDFSIETHSSHYTLKTKLPGFTIDGITLATTHHRQLVIVADKWDESNGGHFERRVTFGTDADLRCTRASFDGTLLKITVPRRA